MVRLYWESDSQWNDRQWVENQRHENEMMSIETAIGVLLLSVFGR
jgi:hypothetical protein